MTTADFLILGLAAAGAGAFNAIAGGGTLISFPVLLALGVPPVAANVTNAIALCPGYFGATLAQRENLRGQMGRVWLVVPMAIVGGVVGALILLRTGDRTFQALVPYMLFAASLLLAVQDQVRRFAVRRAEHGAQMHARPIWALVAVGLAGVYGGFFSAGMSVVLLAVLAATLDDAFTRLNALKQVAAFSVNVAATVFFLFSEQVIWSAVGIMAIGALLGGAAGGRVASRLNPLVLRWAVVTVGFLLAIYYWVTG